VVDIERGVEAVFEPYMSAGKRPRPFDDLREVCILLTMKAPNALLLVPIRLISVSVVKF
jgi:hypothetical protein